MYINHTGKHLRKSESTQWKWCLMGERKRRQEELLCNICDCSIRVRWAEARRSSGGATDQGVRCRL